MKQNAIRKKNSGTKVHVEANIDHAAKIVAVLDAVGNGSLFLRKKIDGAWYFHPLTWSSCDEKRRLYPVVARLYRYLRRQQITKRSLQHLAHGPHKTRGGGFAVGTGYRLH